MMNPPLVQLTKSIPHPPTNIQSRRIGFLKKILMHNASIGRAGVPALSAVILAASACASAKDDHDDHEHARGEDENNQTSPGHFDEFLVYHAENGDMSVEEYREYFTAGCSTDVDRIVVKRIRRFQGTMQKSDHFHIFMGDDRAALLIKGPNWPTYFPSSMSGPGAHLDSGADGASEEVGQGHGFELGIGFPNGAFEAVVFPVESDGEFLQTDFFLGKGRGGLGLAGGFLRCI